MGIKYDFNNIVDLMLKEFPELYYEYNQLRNAYENLFEKPGQHVIFGKIFVDYLVDMARKDPKSYLIQRMLRFLERMAASEDKDLRFLVEHSILDSLIENDTLPLIERALLPATQNLSLQIATKKSKNMQDFF